MAVARTQPLPDVVEPRLELVPPPPPPSTVLPPARRVLVTVTLLAATFMEVIDTSIVNVALPSMQGKLGVTLDEVSWVSTGYIISNVVVLPLTAWLSDTLGRRRFLGYSLILFTAASVGCGLSGNLYELVIFRILQGAGGAAFLSTAQATMLEIYPPAQKGMAQAMFGIGVMMAPTLGPSLGGYLTDHYSWPFIFFVNVPVGIIATALTFLSVPDSLVAGARKAADFVGIGLLAIGLGSLQTVLERGEADDWLESGFIVALVVSALLGLVLFAWWELRPENRAPAVDLRLLTESNLVLGCVYGGLLGFLLYGSVFAVPQFLQALQGHSAQQTGAILIPGGLATAVGMALVGKFVGKLDLRALVAAGMLAFGGSAWLFLRHLSVAMPDAAYFWPLICRGLGFGLAFVPLSLIALGRLRPQAVSQGAGLYNLFRQLGGSFGIALLTTILDRRGKAHFAAIADHVSVTRVDVQQRLALYAAGLAQRGLPPETARDAALRALAGVARQQAMVGAFIDVFWALGIAAALGVLGVVLFRRPSGAVAPGAVH